MNPWIFPPATVGLPILERSELFPVGRIFCVGQNYADHAREMGSDPDRQPPFFFTKPPTALTTGPTFVYPQGSQRVEHEIELVLALGPGAEVVGHTLGLDMTRRDLQLEAKKLGRPWDPAKGFEGSAPCAPLLWQPAWPEQGAIWLEVNGERRQSGDLQQMIWKPREILQHLSCWFELRPGDLVFTGTPAGVGPVVVGDRLRAGIDGVGQLELEVVQ